MRNPPEPYEEFAGTVSIIQFIITFFQNFAQEETNMKKNLGIAVENFLGIAAMISLLDLLAARFDFDVFKQIIGQPGHIAFVVVLGLILAVGAFTGSAAEMPEASRKIDDLNLPKQLGQCI